MLTWKKTGHILRGENKNTWTRKQEKRNPERKRQKDD